MATNINRIGISALLITCGMLLVTGYWLTTAYTSSRNDFLRKSAEALKKTYRNYLFQELSLQPDSTEGSNAYIDRKNIVSALIFRFADSTLTSDFSDTLSKQLTKKFYARLSKVPSKDELLTIYYKELLAAGINTPVELSIIPYQGEEETKWKALMGDYDSFLLTAGFPELKQFIIRSIRPQIAFAFLFICLSAFCTWYIIYLMKQQRQLNDMKEQFLRNMTHELKTPIAVLSAINESLLNFGVMNDPHKTNHYLLSSKTEIKRLSDMVDRVLHLSQFQKNRNRMSFSELNINQLLRSVISNYQFVSDINVSFNSKLNNPLMQGNEQDLFTVFNNLLDNSLKYSGSPVTVHIEATDTHHEVLISLQDNGWGIASEHMPRLFERFYRIPSSKVQQIRGTGLGLSFVQEIIAAHDGSIKVQSIVDQGTLFTITFPRHAKS